MGIELARVSSNVQRPNHYAHYFSIDNLNDFTYILLLIKNRFSKMKFFDVKKFFMNFDFKNGCKNDFKDNNEKS